MVSLQAVKMAAPLGSTSRTVSIVNYVYQHCKASNFLKSFVTPSIHQTRGSQYSPQYLDPILDKDQLQKGLDENDPRIHHPIKAPSTDYSISPLFYDSDVQKFTNMMMKGGNKETVRFIMRRLFENLKHAQVERYNKATTDQERNEIVCDPLTVFKQAVDNCKPLLLTKRVVKGGVAYRVPVAARPTEQRFKSIKWLIESCRDERKFPMEQKLAWEILDAFGNQGRAIRKKQEMHRICESNRAYAHLR